MRLYALWTKYAKHLRAITEDEILSDVYDNLQVTDSDDYVGTK